MAEIIQPTDFPVFQAPEKEVIQENNKLDNTPTFSGTTVIEPEGVIDPEEETQDPVDNDEVYEEDKEGYQDSKDTPPAEDFDVVGYFNLATSLGVLKVPEDFEFDEDNPEESIQRAEEYTFMQNYKAAEEALFNEIQDPAIAKLVQHGIEGGKYADLKEFFIAVEKEQDYSSLDLSSEENQVKIYKDYLNSTGKFSDNRINQLIDLLQEEDELGAEAQKAQEYFIQESQKKQEQLNKEAVQKRKQEDVVMRQRQQEFMSALAQTGYSKPQQQRILNSFSPVELDEGVQLRQFEKTLVDIQRNPQHFIEFLTLLNEYEPSKGFTFDRVEKQKETKATKAVLQKFKEAAAHVSMNKGSRGSIEDKPIIPRQNPYVENIKRY